MSQPSPSIRLLALEFLGEFARLQEAIEEVGYMFFKKKTPHLLKFINHTVLKRMKDEDRISLLKSLFSELDIPHSPHLKSVFNQVKKLRDAIAHSSQLIEEENGSLSLKRGMFDNHTEDARAPKISSVTREEVMRLKLYCSWLQAHVFYMLDSSDLTKKIYLGSKEITFLQPSDHPDGWDGTTFKPAQLG